MEQLGYFPIALLLYVLIFGLVGGLIGERKGRSGAGFIFGALLGPIGWLIIAVGPDIKAEQAALHARKCPACMGSVPDGARKCMHCGEDLAVQLAPAPVPVPKPAKPPTPKELADGSHIPCPHCGQRLRVSTLKQGENWCICCFEKFIVE
jgi:DNA-directed RNA polymerase subunit RPC12/RpoP